MDKFVTRSKKPVGEDVANDGVISSEKRARTEKSCDWVIISDPALRKPIMEYDISIRDDVRREYVVKGPCQPRSHDFPQSDFGKSKRSFQKQWFNNRDWLEYSVSQDAAYCLWCYLFNGDLVEKYGDGVFVKEGCRNWKKALEKFSEHVGHPSSQHNEARVMFISFRNQRQSITRCLSTATEVQGVAYRIRLTASLDCARYLLEQGLPFRGHDESITSKDRGNFLHLLNWYGLRKKKVGKVVLSNAPQNHQLTSPPIQKDIAKACASETTNVIFRDLGDKFFSILVDESRDISVKEQMAIVLRYVDDQGGVVERFVGLVHVLDTTALSLKSGIDGLFAQHGLSISKLRGQGYDGASNMRGEYNGLKTLILQENPYARYIHCFAHQLQLVIVGCANKVPTVANFFEYLVSITNMVGVSCKRKDEFRQIQHDNMVERLEKGEISTGRGLNQESFLARPGTTRWGSHYTTIIRLLMLWDTTITVLENLVDDGPDPNTKGGAANLGEKMVSYQFVFIAHLMKLVLGWTNALSQMLQQKDQNIVAAMSQVEITKKKFQDLRENGWEALLEEVNDFCVKNDLTVLKMEDNVTSRFRSRRAGEAVKMTNHHFFRVEIFCQVIDQITQEMGHRFNESSTTLLKCSASLNPRNSFSNYSKSNLLQLAELYLEDFSDYDRYALTQELDVWIYTMREDDVYSALEDIGDLAKKMVEDGSSKAFHLVYRLIELVLVLPVATATVERAFSAMSLVKTDLRNRMGDEYLNDSLVCYIEKEIFMSIENEVILQHFQKMKTRKMDLPHLMSK